MRSSLDTKCYFIEYFLFHLLLASMWETLFFLKSNSRIFWAFPANPGYKQLKLHGNALINGKYIEQLVSIVNISLYTHTVKL